VTVIACTQEHILPDECIECGGWLHAEIRGGVPGPCGQYCCEDCAASATEHMEQSRRDTHLYNRDLLCACAQVCAPAGHPTAAELAEYQTYVEAISDP
jgi:hypothetical protein